MLICHFISLLTRAEVVIMRKIYGILASFASLQHTYDSVICLIAFVTLVFTGTRLTPFNIFTMVGLLSENRRSLVYGLTDGMQLIADCFASLDRIEHFLLIEELANGKSRRHSKRRESPKDHKPKEEGNYIKAIDLTCHWNGLNEAPVLSNINMDLKENKLALITGPVGCGKSTLLLTLLEELMPTSGEVQRKGSIVYVPQTAWVFSGTVRENILFSKPYDEKRYQETLEACDLAKDVERLPDGDKTTLGERGASLSGGQKARVNLARAVYADADIYLLDDPLSAVDAKVGKHIFETCISGMLSNKIRVLVTHQLQYLKNADYVMILDTKGTIEHEGDYFQLQVSYEGGVGGDCVIDLLKHVGMQLNVNEGQNNRFQFQEIDFFVLFCLQITKDFIPQEKGVLLF